MVDTYNIMRQMIDFSYNMNFVVAWTKW